jgi:hypothetical protein
MSADAWMEPTRPGDHYADYCQWPYDPPAPTGGKLRQSSLFWAALDAAGAHPNLAAACRELRRVLGPFRTVYGVKLQDGRLSFEFYFYDYARLDRELSIPAVLAALSPYVKCDLPPLEQRPYFMFSLDLDDAIVSGQAPLAEIDLYIGNPGSTVSSGICYAHRAEGLELKNFYFFFDARQGRRQRPSRCILRPRPDPLARNGRLRRHRRRQQAAPRWHLFFPHPLEPTRPVPRPCGVAGTTSGTPREQCTPL